MLIRDRVAVVTGIGPGMGKEIALLLARNGAKLAIGARGAATVEETAAEIRTFGGEVITATADLSNEESCAAIVHRAAEAFGGVDIVVQNGAAIGDYKLVEDADPATWRHLFEANVMGSVYLYKAALPYMKAKGDGRIILINSGAGINRAPAGLAPYGVSKAGLAGLVRSIALEAGRYQTTRRGETTFLSLINMVAPTTLSANADGTITTKLLLQPQTFVETSPYLWHQVGGHDKLQAKVVDGKVVTWSTDYLAFAFAYEPLHGLAGAGLEVPFLVASLLVLLASVLAWPIGAAARKWYGAAPLSPAVRTGTRQTAGAAIAGLVATVAWATLFGVVAAITTPHLDTWVHVVQLISFIGFFGGWLVATWNLVQRVRTPGRRGSTVWAALQFAAFTMVLWVAFAYHLLNFSAGY